MDDVLKKRIESIDVLRGIVMVLMALDHVRDFFHISASSVDPLNIINPDLPLFFTRWITHLCAPIFVFLSGTSIYLQSLRKSRKELGSFVLKRGLWLILAELTIIGFAWSFNPYFNSFLFQVIWAIGISMVILGLLLLINFSYTAILIVGALIVVGHNAFDFMEAAPGFKAGFLWDLVHSGRFKFYPIGDGRGIFIVYPFLPWTGLMMLGYCFGILFKSNFPVEKRIRYLWLGGVMLIILFIALRYSNLYGDPFKWSPQATTLQSFLGFIRVVKYPPSLLYMLITIGIGLILLSFLENAKNGLTSIFRTFGRTAFFYYILHIFLIHFIAMIFYFIRGNKLEDVWTIGKDYPFLFIVPGQGNNLLTVYVIWLAVVAILYPICKWYDKYKSTHKQKRWLSYL